MARNAVGASAARVVNSRDTVGSEATRPEHTRFLPQQSNISEAVPAHCDGHRQIEHNLAWIMGGQGLAPR